MKALLCRPVKALENRCRADKRFWPSLEAHGQTGVTFVSLIFCGRVPPCGGHFLAGESSLPSSRNAGEAQLLRLVSQSDSGMSACVAALTRTGSEFFRRPSRSTELRSRHMRTHASGISVVVSVWSAQHQYRNRDQQQVSVSVYSF